MEKIAVVILAAGLGKRTGSKLPKVLLETREKRPLISYVIDSIQNLDISQIAVVVGYERELVENMVLALSKDAFEPTFCHQLQQLGTGDAVKATKASLEKWQGPILILCGDMPLVRTSTIKSLVENHEAQKATISLVTATLNEDNDFGRIARDSQGRVAAIIEKKDCTPIERGLPERNVGIYCVESSFLFPALDRLQSNNAQSEFYLTDIVRIAVAEGQTVISVPCSSQAEALGVNDPYDLMLVDQALNRRRIEDLSRTGVRFLAPDSVIIDADSKIAGSVVIGPAVQILGNSIIGENVVIEGSAVIKDSKIGNSCTLKLGSYLNEAVLAEEVKIGPFVNLRPGTTLGKSVNIGNFVELKNAQLAEGAKANHLTYLGDCEVGENSNIGAGTITCNYDGVKKSRTNIGKNVFIGSNSALVAPVSIGDGAVVGAGSVITKNVEEHALAIARAQQIFKAGWAKNRSKKKST